MLNNESLHPDDSVLHCSAVWHLRRLTGRSAYLTIPLYERSMAVAHASGNFFVSLRKAAPYFNCHENELYRAAHLLLDAEWWTTDDGKPQLGRPVRYHPHAHDLWAESHPGTCCKKLDMPWNGGDLLGQQLYAVTGGQQFFEKQIDGFRKKSGRTDAELLERAKQFVAGRTFTRGQFFPNHEFRMFLCAR
jgi:hypothetical protein